MTSIIDFLKEKDIAWFPIVLDINETEKDDPFIQGLKKKEKKLKPIKHNLYLHKGKTNKKGEKYDSYLPEYTDFKELNYDFIEARQSLYLDDADNNHYGFNAIWIDTSKIAQIDIDCPVDTIADKSVAEFVNGVLIKDNAYYKSITKPYGYHFFVSIDDNIKDCIKNNAYKFKTEDNKKIEDIDFLCGQGAYAFIDAVVENAHRMETCDEELFDEFIFIEPTFSNTKTYENYKPQGCMLPTNKTHTNKNLPIERLIVGNESIEYNPNNISDEDMKLADIIDTKDIDDYKSWIKMMWACKYADKFDLAVYISKRSSKYQGLDDVLFNYNKFNPKKEKTISFGTFYYYAKKGDFDKFKEIRSQYNNLNVEFMGKTFNRLDFEDGVETEKEAVLKVLSVYDDFVCVDKIQKVIYGFDYSTGMWIDGEALFKNIVIEMDEYLKIKTWNEKKKDYVVGNKSYGNTMSRLKDAVKYFVNYISSQSKYFNKTFFEDRSSSSKGCLLYKNGILKTNNETKTLEFVEGFDKNIIFTTRINADYIPPNTEKSFCDYEDINDVKRVFFDIFGEQQDYFIEFLATAIFGKTLKYAGFVIGDSNAGKSTLLNTIRRAFTSGIVGSYDLCKFLIQKNKSTDASRNRWVLLSGNKRLLVSSESVNGTIDHEEFKKMVSGGKDVIEARLHQGNEECVIPDFMLLSMLNSMPVFDEIDEALKNRLLVFKLEKKYVDVVNNPDTEMKKLTDDELSEYNNDQFTDAFRWVIIDAYTNFLKRGCKFEISDKLKGYLDEVFESNVSSRTTDKEDLLMEIFDFTGNEDDKIKSADVCNELMKNKVLSYLATNAKERSKLFDKCAKVNNVNVSISRVYFGKERVRSYIGLRLKDNAPDDDIDNMNGCAINLQE